MLAGVLPHRVGEVEHRFGRVDVGEAAEHHAETAQVALLFPALVGGVAPRQRQRELDAPIELANDVGEPVFFGRREGSNVDWSSISSTSAASSRFDVRW